MPAHPTPARTATRRRAARAGMPQATHRLGKAWRALRAGLALLACAGALAPVAAAPMSQFAPLSGSGNVSVFDANLGTGGWVGRLDGLVDTATGDPFGMVSVVLFTLDAATGSVTGQFELTGEMDLGSTLFGSLAGSTLASDFLTLGGQLGLDYLIEGGTGVFTGASGFGLAFLDYDPMAAADNYLESGLLVLTVPEPGGLALAGAAAIALLLARRPGGGRAPAPLARTLRT